MKQRDEERGALFFLLYVILLITVLGSGYAWGSNVTENRMLSMPDTTFVLPEPMYVGEVLGLNCYIEPRVADKGGTE